MANHHELPISASNAEPFDVITMNSRVIYVEEPGGERRSVTLAPARGQCPRGPDLGALAHRPRAASPRARVAHRSERGSS